MANGVYALDRLFEDAVARRRNVGAPQSVSASSSLAEIAEVWAAIDRYASDCLEHSRGLVLPNLCRFGWQAVRLRGKTSKKPYFQMADAFCRLYGVDKMGGGPPPPDKDLLPMEEFNFSKAAIRFSSELTKDQVSSGLRLLTREVGEAASQGKALALEFSFGKLVSKEKCVQLVFAAQLYLAHGLEVPADAAEDIEYRPPPTFGKTLDSSTLASLELKGDGLQDTPLCRAKAEGNRSGFSRGSSSTRPSSVARSAASWEYTQHATADILHPSGSSSSRCQTGQSGRSWSSSRPVAAPNVPKLVTGSTVRRVAPTGRPSAEEHAQEEALHRQITELEIRASEALRAQAVRSNLSEQKAAEEESERAERRAREIQNREALKLQIQTKAERRRAQAAEAEQEALVGAVDARTAESSSTSQASPCLQGGSGAKLPAGVGSGVTPRSAMRPPPLKVQLQRQVAQSGLVQGRTLGVGDENANVLESSRSRNAANEMRQALEAQILAKKAHRNALREFEQRLEASVLETGAREEVAQREQEQAVRSQERELLAAAWREQSRIKGIQQAIEAVEFGKCLPSCKTILHDSAEAAGTPLSARSARPETWSGNSAMRQAFDADGRTPKSARGAPIGAAASLSLRGAPLIDVS